MNKCFISMISILFLAYTAIANAKPMSDSQETGQKPSIINVKCISITTNSMNAKNYDIQIGVKYEGSDWLTAYAREKGTSIAYTFHVNQPDTANITLTNIRLWDETYVTVTATNQYGTASYTITIPSRDDLPMSINDVQNSEYTIYSDGNQIEVDMLGKTAKSIELYSVNGTLVARRQYRNSIATNTLPHGIYVLIITDDKNVKTVKKLRL